MPKICQNQSSIFICSFTHFDALLKFQVFLIFFWNFEIFIFGSYNIFKTYKILIKLRFQSQSSVFGRYYILSMDQKIILLSDKLFPKKKVVKSIHSSLHSDSKITLQTSWSQYVSLIPKKLFCLLKSTITFNKKHWDGTLFTVINKTKKK